MIRNMIINIVLIIISLTLIIIMCIISIIMIIILLRPRGTQTQEGSGKEDPGKRSLLGDSNVAHRWLLSDVLVTSPFSDPTSGDSELIICLL